ncbi:hypothetical protein Vadar_009842 [Vaccinium darrowii]|uniref:Uncharacterized protein n=1 Tax=Vaccinium darrowii TaxID=229202 RepID=A0ACB7ZIK8_9ERIC|nr:hypothetical protein Vadar_009842 [Vaccinium darrowii]
MGILACIGVVLPFPFYYWLWNYPQTWVDICGNGRDPSKIMARVSHLLKLVQFISLFSVSSLSWPPPLYFWPLFLFGQFLNFRVYQLLGESGTYYGVRFGKNIPWVSEFPFGVINDPQCCHSCQATPLNLARNRQSVGAISMAEIPPSISQLTCYPSFLVFIVSKRKEDMLTSVLMVEFLHGDFLACWFVGIDCMNGIKQFFQHLL